MGIKLEIAQQYWTAPQTETIGQYIGKPLRNEFPSLDPENISMEFLHGEERSELEVTVAGEASLLLRYKNREGHVSCLNEADDDLEIVQFKGAHRKGYRLMVGGLQIPQLIADQVQAIATNPEAPFRRITMAEPKYLTDNMTSVQSPHAIPRIPDAIKRYKELALSLGMRYSDEERKYIFEVTQDR